MGAHFGRVRQQMCNYCALCYVTVTNNRSFLCNLRTTSCVCYIRYEFENLPSEPGRGLQTMPAPPGMAGRTIETGTTTRPRKSVRSAHSIEFGLFGLVRFRRWQVSHAGGLCRGPIGQAGSLRHQRNVPSIPISGSADKRFQRCGACPWHSANSGSQYEPGRFQKVFETFIKICGYVSQPTIGLRL
jgi:hypothetical protein